MQNLAFVVWFTMGLPTIKSGQVSLCEDIKERLLGASCACISLNTVFHRQSASSDTMILEAAS